jgi:uncharacterized membrane protein
MEEMAGFAFAVEIKLSRKQILKRAETQQTTTSLFGIIKIVLIIIIIVVTYACFHKLNVKVRTSKFTFVFRAASLTSTVAI